jgi:hypothetical protein
MEDNRWTSLRQRRRRPVRYVARAREPEGVQDPDSLCRSSVILMDQPVESVPPSNLRVGQEHPIASERDEVVRAP